MGSTVTTNQVAAAFRSAGSEHTTWCLFEQTYEKNCYPHTPHWSCIAIGRVDAAMKRIFSAAADCEGGMLQTRSGDIRPETYIDRWIAAMRHPVVMPDVEVSLTGPGPTGSPWLDDKYAAQWATVRERYTAMRPAEMDGGLNMLDRLETGESLEVSLHRHPELASAVVAGRPWKALKEPTILTIVVSRPRSAELGYRPDRACGAATPASVPPMLRVDRETRIVKVDGVWRQGGWPYFMVGAYVRSLAERELEAPGSYKRLIGEYRKAVEGAPPVPAATTVVVPLVPLAPSDRGEVIKMAKAAGGTVTEGVARIPWGGAESAAPAHFLLGGHDVTWEVPKPQEQDVTRAESQDQEEMDFER